MAASWQALLLIAVMFAGTVVYRCQHGQIGRTPAGLALSVVAVCLVLAHPAHLLWLANTGAVAVTLAVAFAARHRPVPRVPGFLGRVSYSLYLLHVVVLMLLARLVPDLVHRPVGMRLAVGVAFLAPALSVAWTSYTLIEVPRQGLGRRLATQRAAARTGGGEFRNMSV